MKKQIARLSPHQNAKVFAVLITVASLFFLVPMFVVVSFVAPEVDQKGPPAFVFLLLPLFYLVFGYISVAIGCALYNYSFRFLGGFEFESRREEEGRG